MEEDVIDDINTKLHMSKLEIPEAALWLRPTFVFRSRSKTLAAISDVLEKRFSASRVVTEVDPRLYLGKGLELHPLVKTSKASMVRRQGLSPFFHVYNADVFRWPTQNCPSDFLGSRISFHIAEKVCGMDIDDLEDFNMVEALLNGGISPIRF
jgi:hypothetical protein